VDLVLPVDKARDLTSHDVVARVRRAVGQKSVGHAGTLDPFATGVLVVLLGRATKIARVVTAVDKSYHAHILLGRTTDTDDSTGAILHERPADVTAAQVEVALERFRGTITQVPPRISAVWVDGERMYRRARRGEDVSPPPRTVHVSRLELLALDGPLLTVRLDCSSGTYVRSLARDLGEVLGTGALVQALVRLRVGPFTLDRALHSSALDATDARERVREVGRTIEQALAFLPRAVLDSAAAARLMHGQAPCTSELAIEPGVGGGAGQTDTVCLMGGNGCIIALAEMPAADEAADRPVKLLRVLHGADDEEGGAPSQESESARSRRVPARFARRLAGRA
jgi:tRNA pseudouridine55 synthase